MAQVKIFGLRKALRAKRNLVSSAIHRSLSTSFALPAEKCFHRFIYFSEGDFIFPEDRTSSYTIIEIHCFEGRSVEAKRALISSLFAEMSTIGISPPDLEVAIIETPRHNWGIRGHTGDTLALTYRVEV